MILIYKFKKTWETTSNLQLQLFYFFVSSVVTKPPYEITETGWGEFEIIIKIFFIDPNERPVSNGYLSKYKVDLFSCENVTIVNEELFIRSHFYSRVLYISLWHELRFFILNEVLSQLLFFNIFCIGRNFFMPSLK